MQQLHSSFKSRSKDAVEVNRQYRNVLQQMDALEKERLSIDRTMVDKVVKDTTHLDRNELKMLLENRDHLKWLLSQKNIWYVGEEVGPYGAPYMHRDRAVLMLTEKFMEAVVNKDEYANTESFTEQLKFIKNFTAGMRAGMREDLVRMEDRIVVLQNKISMADRKPVDISGCWVILLAGSNDLPQVTIVDEGNGTYVGYLSYVGNLIEQYRPNHRLFRVHRTSDKTFSGTEYSFNSAGQMVNVKLNISVNQGNRSLTYRSDYTYQMGQCRVQ